MSHSIETIATIFEKVAKRKKNKKPKRTKEEREMYRYYGFTDKNFAEMPTAAPPEEEGASGTDEEGDDYEAYWED